MADREVSSTGKDRDGDITKLCKSGELWSPRSKQGAIQDTNGKRHEYYVRWPEKRTAIRVVSRPTGEYLRTDRDNTTRNILDDLPDR
ncbi:DUF3892 domain-containing protein [Candidatus Bipolaricaulota bacterium]|nr:DUF3892 domain-containing protein [Candidatus Bipolaricaulota bacterium]